jgi:hypothetical protein
MALEQINIGNYANDGSGDDLRTAFTKINNNFQELQLLGGQNNTISNVGSGIGIYKEKIGNDLKLKSLTANSGISLTNSPNEVNISYNRNHISIIVSDNGTLIASTPEQAVEIRGGTNIETSLSENVLTITNTYSIANDPNPVLNGNLDLNNYNIVNANFISATDYYGRFNGPLIGTTTGTHVGSVIGNVTGLVFGIDIRNLQDSFNFSDFGPINGSVSSAIDWIIATTNIDMGTMSSPATIGLDFGIIIESD